MRDKVDLDSIGIAIAIFYLPLLGVIAALALFLGRRFAQRTKASTPIVQRFGIYVAAVLAATALTLFVASLVPERGSSGWSALFARIAVTLVLPRH